MNSHKQREGAVAEIISTQGLPAVWVLAFLERINYIGYIFEVLNRNSPTMSTSTQVS